VTRTRALGPLDLWIEEIEHAGHICLGQGLVEATNHGNPGLARAGLGGDVACLARSSLLAPPGANVRWSGRARIRRWPAQPECGGGRWLMADEAEELAHHLLACVAWSRAQNLVAHHEGAEDECSATDSSQNDPVFPSCGLILDLVVAIDRAEEVVR
jgi:hypothetical protein